MSPLSIQRCIWSIRDRRWCIYKRYTIASSQVPDSIAASGGDLHTSHRLQVRHHAVASMTTGCAGLMDSIHASLFGSIKASTACRNLASRVWSWSQHGLCRPVLLSLHAGEPCINVSYFTQHRQHCSRSITALLCTRATEDCSVAAGCDSQQATAMNGSAECAVPLGMCYNTDDIQSSATYSNTTGERGSKQQAPISPVSPRAAWSRTHSKALSRSRSTGTALREATAAIRKLVNPDLGKLHSMPTPRCMQPRQLTAAIKHCSTVQALHHLVQQSGLQMNHINVVAAIARLSKLLNVLHSQQQMLFRHASSKLLDQLLQLLGPKLPQCSARDLANMIYALCMISGAVQQQYQDVIQHTLLPRFKQLLTTAKPQEVSCVLYALARGDLVTDPVLVQHLLGQLCRQSYAAKPQEISNSLWAMAKMGQPVNKQHWCVLSDAFMRNLDSSKFLEMQMFIWAAAVLQQQLGRPQMLLLLDALAGRLHEATPQGVANTLWACGRLGFCPQQLLASPVVLKALPGSNALELSQIGLACGQLGHRDEQLMAALIQHALKQMATASTNDSGSSSSSTRKAVHWPLVVCSICWSIAVLNLQQHAADVLVLVRLCRQQWQQMIPGGFEQLHQVHTWLLDCQLAGGQGLLGTLTAQQLQQCKQAWGEQMQVQARSAVGKFQQTVFAVLQQLPISWQQRPQMEQRSVGRDGQVDGAALIDITAKTADGVLLAIEVDGPCHFRQPDGALTGSTLYRNRALAARGYQVISVPYYMWEPLWGKQGLQQQFLMQLIRAAEQQQQQQQMCTAARLQQGQSSL